MENNSSSQDSYIRHQIFTSSPQNSNVRPQNPNIRAHNLLFHPSHQMNPHILTPPYMYSAEMYQHPYMPSPIYGMSPPRAPGMTSKSSRKISIGGTSTDKECETPSSGQDSPFHPYPSPPGIDAINLDASEDTDDGENVPGPKSRTYAARYTGPENEILAQSWVNVSEDAEIGNAQRLDAMWKRIADDYNKNRPANCPVRRWDLLKTHFYTLQRFVSAFNGLYNQMKRDWGSGQSDVDILMHAMKEWAQSHNNNAFTHLGMWNTLKESPKWINQQERDHCGRKKTKTSAQ